MRQPMYGTYCDPFLRFDYPAEVSDLDHAMPSSGLDDDGRYFFLGPCGPARVHGVGLEEIEGRMDVRVSARRELPVGAIERRCDEYGCEARAECSVHYDDDCPCMSFHDWFCPEHAQDYR